MNTRRLGLSLLLSLCVSPILAQQAPPVIIQRGPTVVPKEFKTRKVGARLNVTAIGSAKEMVSKNISKPPEILLTLASGKSVKVEMGKTIKYKGHVYKAMGWQKDLFLLFSSEAKKSIYFERDAKEKEQPKK